MKETTRLQSIHFLSLFILAMLVNIIGQATHETGHRVLHQVARRNPVWVFTKLAQLHDTPPQNPETWVEKINSDGSHSWLKLSSPIAAGAETAFNAAAGPLAGLLGALIGLIFARRSKRVEWKQIALVFTLSISIAAILYYLRSPNRVGGDEADVAAYFGIAKSAIEIPFALGYVACLFLALRELPAWRIRLAWLGTIFLGNVVTGIPMFFVDDYVIAGVDAGNPFFQPVLGYSLPVFITIILTFIGVWVWSRWQAGTSK